MVGAGHRARQWRGGGDGEQRFRGAGRVEQACWGTD